MARDIAFAGLAFTLVLVLVYIALGILLKFSGYPDDPTVRFNPIAVGLRNHGLWSLILPVLFVVCASSADDEDRWLTAARVGYALVILAVFLLTFLYVAAFSNPYSRSMLIFTRQSSRSS